MDVVTLAVAKGYANKLKMSGITSASYADGYVTCEIQLQDGTTKTLKYAVPKGDKGDTGKGIVSAVLNDNYTITFTYTDGTSTTTSSVQGPKGDTGVGISNAVKDSSGNLIIYYDNGTNKNVGYIKGDSGFTPTITSSKSGKDTTLTITNQSGTTTTHIYDGTDGAHTIVPSTSAAPEGSSVANSLTVDGVTWKIQGSGGGGDVTYEIIS